MNTALGTFVPVRLRLRELTDGQALEREAIAECREIDLRRVAARVVRVAVACFNDNRRSGKSKQREQSKQAHLEFFPFLTRLYCALRAHNSPTSDAKRYVINPTPNPTLCVTRTHIFVGLCFLLRSNGEGRVPLARCGVSQIHPAQPMGY